MSSQKKILIIDDEKEIGYLLSATIKKRGYEVSVSDTLESGTKLFSLTNPDIIFLDINFPDGNGLDYINQFKQKKNDVKVIMISAYDSVADRMKASQLGADGFIGKPFDLRSVNEVLTIYS